MLRVSIQLLAADLTRAHRGAWNWLDWVLAVIVLLSIIVAIRKGLVRELISLAAVIVGIIVAALEYPRAAHWFADLTKSHQVAEAAGFLTVFVLVLIAGAVVSLMARYLVRKAGVEWFDRFLGGIFGLIRGVIIDSIVLMVLMAFAIKPGAIQQSQLAPYVSTGARAMAYLMPRDLRNRFYSEFEKWKGAVVKGTSNLDNKQGSSL